MKNLLQAYKPGASFWTNNPQFTTIQPFKKLYSSDKSRMKTTSSNLMWAIAFINHPKSDAFYVPGKEERYAMDLCKVLKKDVDSFWESNAGLTEAFVDATLTQAQKSLISWENRLKQRDRFLSKQEYHFGYSDPDGNDWKGNSKELDDMNSKTGKFYDEYNKIKKELDEDDIKSSKTNKGYDAREAGI